MPRDPDPGTDADLTGSPLHPIFALTSRFQDPRPLGRGGMSLVFDVLDTARGERVALKTMMEIDPATTLRFKNEWRALDDVVHPNLVILHELLAFEEHLCFTMELLDGTTLPIRRTHATLPASPSSGGFAQPTLDPFSEDSFAPSIGDDERPSGLPAGSGITPSTITMDLEEEPPTARRERGGAEVNGVPLTPERIREIFAGLSRGLSALHDAGRLHRDVKPSNVMITRRGRPVLLDFGLVADLKQRAGLERAGTPEYMAPEQLEGGPLTAATDWYAIGVMLYEALIGRLPCAASTPNWTTLLSRKRSGPPPHPRDFVPDVDPELAELAMALLAEEPGDRPRGVEVLAVLTGAESEPTGPKVSLPLVGRTDELTLLRDAYRAARSELTTLHVSGPSGMGKSALVEQFLDEVRDEAVVLEGRCYERESVPYKGIDSLVDALARHLARQRSPWLPEHAGALAHMFPVLERVRGVEPAAELPDRLEQRRRATRALRALLGHLAEGQALVLHIDDLQWSDLDSVALLDELLQPPHAPRLLFLGSFRSEERERSEALVSLLASERPAGALQVGPLADDQAASLVRAVLGPDASSAPVGDIVGATAGHPLHLTELARHVRDSGGAVIEGTLTELLTARLDRLQGAERSLLETIAVAGRPLSQPLAWSATGREGPATEPLAGLRAAHLVTITGGMGRGQVQAVHDRIREAAVEACAPARLAEVHRRLAEAIVSSRQPDPEALVEHWEGAGESGRAGRAALDAAGTADAALAFDRAASLYRKARDLLPVDDPDARAIPAKLAEALANAGRAFDAAPVYLEASEHAEGGEKLELMRRAAEQYLVSGYIDDGLAAFDQVLSIVGLKLSTSPKAALLSILWRRLWLKVRGLRFTERTAEELGPERLLELDTYWTVSRGLGMVDTVRGMDYQVRHLLLALQCGEPYRVARGLALEGAYLSGSGGKTRARAEELHQRAEELAERVAHPHAIGLARLTHGMGRYLRGEWRAGVTLCREAEEILQERCVNVSWELTNALRFALGAQMYLGEAHTFRQGVLAGLAAARERGDLYAATDIRTRLNLAWLIADEPEAAVRHVREAMKEWSTSGFHLQHYSALLALVQVHLYLDDPAAAQRELDESWPGFEGSLLTRIQMVRVEALHLRARAAVAAAGAGGTDQLAEAEAQAVKIVAEDMPWCVPLGRLIQAACAAQRGDRDSAIDLLATAAKGFEAAEMGLYGLAAGGLLAALQYDDSGVDTARTALVDRSVVAPESMVRMLAPGFPSQHPLPLDSDVL